jgi:hypothetical protein
MWRFIAEFNSCSDLGRQTLISPITAGWVVSVPGFVMLLMADRRRATGTASVSLRHLAGGLIASTVLVTAGIVVPKPEQPCIVARMQLPSRLKELAILQEVFATDSHRYSPSLEALGRSPVDFDTSNLKTTIAWADSASWGAYIVFTDSTDAPHVVRWMCALVYPDSGALSRVVEGVGRLRRGCWQQKHR